MSTPQSNVYICSGVRLDPRYEHSIYFKDRASQENYFAGKVVRTFSAYTYLRKTWPLQVAATMEEARTWSYLYFRNGAGAKTYYYFITQVEYKNDSTVELTLELDVLQTYLHDFTLLDCFVERQHTETDVMGENTLDEGLDVGELKETGGENWTSLNDMCILIMSTINPNYTDTDKPIDALGYLYNNVFSGLGVWAVKASQWGSWSAQLEKLSEAGFIDGIVGMWMYPINCIKLGGEQTWSDDDLCKVVAGFKPASESFTYSRVSSNVDGYTPKNKKVLCWPYRFLYATNNQGGSAVYRFERFGAPNTPKFNLMGAISPDATVKMYPNNYNGVNTVQAAGNTSTWDIDGNYDHGLSLGNFPSCAWDADVYKLWLAQNQNQLQHTANTAGLSILGGAVGAVASLAMGNVVGAVAGAGAVVSGAQQIGALLAQKADMSTQPPQSRGAFSGNVNASAKMQSFTFYTKSVDAEHARMIDNYFTMYGYRINTIRTPNIAARPAFTYIKTVGCNIVSNMCMEDRIRITGIFDRGITFWKNGDKIGDYTQNNTV